MNKCEYSKNHILPIFRLHYTTCSQNISYHLSMPSRHVKSLPKVRNKPVIIFYVYHWLESFDLSFFSFALLNKNCFIWFFLLASFSFAWPKVDLMWLHKIKIIQHIQHLFDSSYNYSCLVLFLCLQHVTWKLSFIDHSMHPELKLLLRNHVLL